MVQNLPLPSIIDADSPSAWLLLLTHLKVHLMVDMLLVLLFIHAFMQLRPCFARDQNFRIWAEYDDIAIGGKKILYFSVRQPLVISFNLHSRCVSTFVRVQLGLSASRSALLSYLFLLMFSPSTSRMLLYQCLLMVLHCYSSWYSSRPFILCCGSPPI